MEGELNRLQFEQVIAEDGDEAAAKALEMVKEEMEILQVQMAPPKAQLDQIGRQFWVTKEQGTSNKHDLSSSRYREIEQDRKYHESPSVTLERIRTLERVINDEVNQLQGMLR